MSDIEKSPNTVYLFMAGLLGVADGVIITRLASSLWLHVLGWIIVGVFAIVYMGATVRLIRLRLASSAGTETTKDRIEFRTLLRVMLMLTVGVMLWSLGDDAPLLKVLAFFVMAGAFLYWLGWIIVLFQRVTKDSRKEESWQDPIR